MCHSSLPFAESSKRDALVSTMSYGKLSSVAANARRSFHAPVAATLIESAESDVDAVLSVDIELMETARPRDVPLFSTASTTEATFEDEAKRSESSFDGACASRATAAS